MNAIYRPELKIGFSVTELKSIRDGPFLGIETTITHAYFGKDRNLRCHPGGQLGLHLIVSAGIFSGTEAEWDATYTRAEDIDGLLNDLSIGSRSFERGVADVSNLKGRHAIAHYVIVEKYGRVLAGMSAPLPRT